MTDNAIRPSLKPVGEELDSSRSRVSGGAYADAARSFRFLWIARHLNSSHVGNVQFICPLPGKAFY